MWKVHGKLRIRLFFKGELVRDETFDQERITIGRDPSCTLVIDNELVSGKHARITREQAGYKIEDLDSTNGTLLNGVEIKSEMLRQGSVVAIGKHQLEFLEEGESEYSESGSGTVAPMTSPTIVAAPDEAGKLIAEAALSAYLKAGGKLGALTLISGKATPELIKLEKERTIVGKNESANIRLKGLFAPDIAFFLELRPEGYAVIPPAAKSKVKLNNKKVLDRSPLTDKDVLTVGSTSFRFTTR